MTGLRVYLPLRPGDLRTLLAEGRLDLADRVVRGVSPTLAAALPRADEEEREQAAFADAVDDAVGEQAAGRRIAVLSFDAIAQDLAWEAQGSGARMRGAVARRDVASCHIGEDASADADLLWYDVTELPQVAELLGD